MSGRMPSMAERSNRQWVDDLEDGGPARERALADLRATLVRGLARVLRDQRHPGGGNAAALTEDFVQEALLRILERLDTYEGRSAFTTWAMKVAIRVALTELRRKRWRDVSLDAATELGRMSLRPKSRHPEPGAEAARSDTVAWITRLIGEALTEKQQTAMQATAFGGVPMEEVARRLGTNRNAVYKLLHDARKRLKRRLEEEGVTADEILRQMEDA